MFAKYLSFFALHQTAAYNFTEIALENASQKVTNPFYAPNICLYEASNPLRVQDETVTTDWLMTKPCTCT